MRKVSILSLWFAAFLMAVCFIGCSNGSSSGDGNSDGNSDENSDENSSGSSGASKNVVYKATEESFIYTAVFQADGTFYINVAMNAYDMGNEWEGTYTGDASKDGTIIVTILKHLEGRELKDYEGADKTQDIEITDGKFTFEYNEYTRQ